MVGGAKANVAALVDEGAKLVLVCGVEEVVCERDGVAEDGGGPRRRPYPLPHTYLPTHMYVQVSGEM